MKFIFSFLFAFIFILPVSADNQCTDLTQTTNPTCTDTAGCVWEEGECTQCQSGTYSTAGGTTCISCEDGFNSGWETQHKAHPDGAGSCNDFICIGGYIKSDDGQNCILLNCPGIVEPKFLPDGETNCDNWQCRAGYYRGGTNNDECKTCPSNSGNCTTNGGNYGLTTETVECDTNYQKFESDGGVTCKKCPEHSKYNPTTKSCECANGANGTFGINSSCACANNSDYNENNNECECTTAPYLNPTYDNNGVLTCSSCATNATYDDDNNECKCNADYYGDGDTRCTACPRNSTTDDATGKTSISDCICNIGYYDTDGSDANDTVSCTKCPIGMTTVTFVGDKPTNTTTKGATSINQCAMNHNTKFCIPIQDPAQRQQCFTLDGAAKINDREINSTNSPTNSGN